MSMWVLPSGTRIRVGVARRIASVRANFRSYHTTISRGITDEDNTYVEFVREARPRVRFDQSVQPERSRWSGEERRRSSRGRRKVSTAPDKGFTLICARQVVCRIGVWGLDRRGMASKAVLAISDCNRKNQA